ncbi:unnamed protein product [Callosobruchus maculatus]|uniref:Uncharacterized protein n=1 Tax=Callosobruchus maculatus TaxID=64391 RepID=A0A653DT13_CALMS|nr:unnamed protein product [Callosobruchus maculatus]
MKSKKIKKDFYNACIGIRKNCIFIYDFLHISMLGSFDLCMLSVRRKTQAVLFIYIINNLKINLRALSYDYFYVYYLALFPCYCLLYNKYVFLYC